jgi:hypothetical protein
MKLRLLTVFLVAGAQSAAAQSTFGKPAGSSPPLQVHSSAFGFTYAIPAGWEIVARSEALPNIQRQIGKEATTDAEKRGVGCVQVALTARHGDPLSVVVVAGLPFDCYGEPMNDKDLPGFARGVLGGISGFLEISEPVSRIYPLGSHNLWIERLKANAKGHSDLQYTAETVCTILKRGAVCWVVLAADENALTAFEGGAVALDGDAQAALVPANVFGERPF